MAGQLNELLSLPQYFLICLIAGYTKMFSVACKISTTDAAGHTCSAYNEKGMQISLSMITLFPLDDAKPSLVTGNFCLAPKDAPEGGML